MPSYAKQILSGSTNGRGVLVAATATPGTLIHTAVTGTTDWDEIYLWAINTTATDRLLTIEFGGVTDPADTIQDSIVSDDGAILIVPGWLLNNAVVVRAFAAATNAVSVFGYAIRRTT